MRDKAAAMCPHKVKAVNDFEKLLGDPDLDALVIATPNFHHIDVLRSALETGKPILCEKPLCTTLDDTREIFDPRRGGQTDISSRDGISFQAGFGRYDCAGGCR